MAPTELRLALALLLAVLLGAAAPAPTAVTPDLVSAAQKEGKLAFYTSIELRLAERLAHDFEAKYPGITVEVERSGAERIFQRVAQEQESGVHAADIVESSDIGHARAWKREGLLGAFVPEDVARWPADARDADGFYAADRATLSVLGYNTKLVKPEDAPKSYADLLDPKWRGKIVKAHPGYSGVIMTATFAQVAALGWPYFEKLAGQRVMQVQSAADPPRKLVLGERAVMADGGEYLVLEMIAAGNPLAIVYPSEGTPIIFGSAGLMKDAPHPNAARLFLCFLFSRETQQMMSEAGGTRSLHPDVADPQGRTPLSAIKLLRTDPAAQEKAIPEIRRKYAEYFGT
jgi:iron(III) transport system substrate-binding protein